MIPHERSLVKRLEGKPFALLGINSDKDRIETRKRCRDEGMTWRSWVNGSSGSTISSAWGVRGWPTIYVLDHKGVVRFKGVRGEAMDKAVDQLLDELQKSGGK